MKCTCKDCSKRYIGCHGKCEEYKKWREEQDIIKQKIIKQKHIDEGFIDNIIKTAKRKK